MIEKPSNETLYALMKDIKDMNTKEHEAIIKRLDYTNGNVTKNTLWRAKITGAYVVLWAVFASAVIPLILKVF